MKDARRHILTVAVEDWFQVGAFHEIVQEGRWYRFETRVERNVRRALDLLDEHDATATFFVLGWIADEMPEIVREIAERGHEVATKGYFHRSIARMGPGEFREDLVRSRESIERATGQRVLGHRVGGDWFGPGDLWALDLLQEEGFAYDSSIFPMFRAWKDEPHRRFLHEQAAGDGTIWEVPLSALPWFGQNWPIAGGNWIRQFPHALLRRGFERWQREFEAPFVMYFQIWELDEHQPKLGAASWLTQQRHYRNLGKLQWVLPEYLKAAPFAGVADWLGLERPAAELPPAEATPAPAPSRAIASARRAGEEAPAEAMPVTLVVPCFNEELVLPYLGKTLDAVRAHYEGVYDFRYLFVDDCSEDGTYRSLQELFGERPECRIERHERNEGVARAILTGIVAADTEIVASIDCDCTYDPHQLGNLLPHIADSDLVTASPYHAAGEVRNVPEWRLILSRGLSALYAGVLPTKLATYTSCFRIYRRSVMHDLPIRNGGFLGVAETLGLLDLRGHRIVECPAVLEVRMLGRSKMKIVTTILGHLRLLASLGAQRTAGATRAVHPPTTEGEVGAPSVSLPGTAHPEGNATHE